MEENSSNSKSEHIISQHIFMFPFRFSDDRPLSEWKKLAEKSSWEYKPFVIDNSKSEDSKLDTTSALFKDSAAKYNENAYFHEHTRRAILTRDKIGNSNENVSIYFEKDLKESSCFIINVKFKDDKENIIYKDYSLDVEHISLRIFDTNVGILTIELLNRTYCDINDIFIINDFGRRIYPQFIGEQNGIEETKENILPNKVTLKINEKEYAENFILEDFLTLDIKLAKYIEGLLGTELYKEIIPVIDDRMYVLCWYGSNIWSRNLRQKNKNGYQFETSDEWYKFVFIDGKGKGAANKEMEKELVKETTYSRWIEYGILYGISRYSFVCLTDRGNFSYNQIRNHMQRMYYQMAIMILAQRASMLKFSNDISKITAKVKQGETIGDETFNKVKKLYSSFIRFENMLNFIEVTPQEQGIEMYKMAYRNMGLEEMMNKLKSELDRLHQFVELQYSKERNQNISKLQIISLVLPFPTASILCTFFAPKHSNWWLYNFAVNALHFSNQTFWFLFFFIIVFIIFLTILLWPWPFKKK